MSSYIPKSKRKPSKIAGIFGIHKVPAPKPQMKEDNVPDSFKQKIQSYDKYPDSLRNYIQKCFLNCSSEEHREFVSNSLIQKIAQVSVQGLVLAYDWGSEKLLPVSEPARPSAGSLMKNSSQTEQNAVVKKTNSSSIAFKSDFIQEKQATDEANMLSKTLAKKEEIAPSPSVEAFSLTKDILPQARKKLQQSQQIKLVVEAKKKAKSLFSAACCPAQLLKKVPKLPAKEKPSVPEIPAAQQRKKKIDQFNEKKESLLNASLDEVYKGNSDIKKKGKKIKNVCDVSVFNPQRKKLARDLSLDDIVKENTIVGTCRDLEKQYLRLTSEPDPQMFRPLEVLKQSLEYCMEKFAKKRDYEYIRDQLRSIRQDLIVQHIEDEFSVLVYETSTRLAIEHFDWDNFNQSLTPLESLYADGYGAPENVSEISGYKIIYLVGFKDTTGLYSFIPKLDEDTFASDSVSFAIEAWEAISGGEWFKFFSMFKEAPALVRNVLSISASSMRFDALEKIRKAFRTPSLEEYRSFLFFDTLDETKKYLADKEIAVPVQ